MITATLKCNLFFNVCSGSANENLLPIYSLKQKPSETSSTTLSINIPLFIILNNTPICLPTQNTEMFPVLLLWENENHNAGTIQYRHLHQRGYWSIPAHMPMIDKITSAVTDIFSGGGLAYKVFSIREKQPSTICKFWLVSGNLYHNRFILQFLYQRNALQLHQKMFR